MNLVLGCSYDSLRFVDSREDYKLIYRDTAIPHHLEVEYGDYINLLFKLNLNGKIIFNSKVKSMSLNESSVDIFVGNKKRNMQFDRCRVYSTSCLNVSCSYVLDCKKIYYAYDEVNISSISETPKQNITRDDSFINTVWFNVSNKHPKLAIVKSILNEDQKDQIEYSDTYVKFNLISILSQLGYNGRKNGFDSNGRQLHLALDLECVSRHVQIIDECLYKDLGRITFHNAK